MEKKTMGTFLSALRKANGMTQKDLADKLNVSDKTVSRWECDDGAPDLSLIPVIAEIFGITCDELLRGERKSPEERVEDVTPKGEKQRRRLLTAALSKYRTQTLIASGISVVGLIAALTCNFAFLRGTLGFLCGAVFLTASVLMQMICMNAAFAGVEDADLEEGELSRFRRTVIRLTERSIGIMVGILSFTMPLILIDDAYAGMDAGHLFVVGAMGAGALLLIYGIVCYFLGASFVRKGIFALSEKEAEIHHHNHKLKRSCAMVLTIVLIVTVLGHVAATTIWSPWSNVKGITFDDYDSLVEYMEQDMSGNRMYLGEGVSAPFEHRLKDENGDVVCVYVQRNPNVASIDYTEKDGSLLPITVYTYDEQQEAEFRVVVRHVIFSCLYALEAAAVLAFYFRKRAK